jgi:mRNA-capping enzyme
MKLRGHGETPSVEHVNTFIYECKKFIQSNPLEVIAVHCTHGFNRTGFLISSFLVQTEDWSPEAAVGAFAKARAPGIYKGDYLRELFR